MKTTTKVSPETNTTQIKISDIKISANYGRGGLSIAAQGLAELADSIKNFGVLQPITVRPLANGKYELVIGERRLRGSQLAEIKTIPAMVKNLTDMEVAEVQIVENLQRENPHPMAEAKGIAMLLSLKDKNYTVFEIAATLGKSTAYVYQRIKLNSIIEEFEPVVFSNKITLYDSLKIAQLHPDAQKEVYEEMFTDWKSKNWMIDDLDWQIRRYKLILKEAKFNTKDANLLPSAGACSGCQYNTAIASASSLFPSEEKGARCTNSKCFEEKTEINLFNKINQLLTKNPELPIAFEDKNGNAKLHKELTANIEGRKIVYKNIDYFTTESYPKPPIREDFDYEDTEEEKEALYQEELTEYKEEVDRLKLLESQGSLFKVLMIDGCERSQILLVSTERKQVSNSSSTGRSEFKAADYQLAVKEKTLSPNVIQNERLRLEQKEVRNEQLDSEKLHMAIFEALKSDPSANTLKSEFGTNDHAVSAFLLYDTLGWSEKRRFGELAFAKSEDDSDSEDEELINFFFSPTKPQLALLIRLSMISNSRAAHTNSLAGKMMQKLAEGTPTVGVLSLCEIQKEITAERKEKLSEKIEGLEKQLEKLKD